MEKEENKKSLSISPQKKWFTGYLIGGKKFFEHQTSNELMLSEFLRTFEVKIGWKCSLGGCVGDCRNGVW